MDVTEAVAERVDIIRALVGADTTVTVAVLEAVGTVARVEAAHTVYFLPKKMSSMRRILDTILGAIFRFLKTKFDSYNRSQANPS